jgi:hypothetical protein
MLQGCRHFPATIHITLSLQCCGCFSSTPLLKSTHACRALVEVCQHQTAQTCTYMPHLSAPATLAVPTEFFANCAEWYPYAWRCIPCCSAACGGGGACKAGGEGKYDTTHGCSACPAGAAPRTLDLPASTCRSCFRSRTCFEEQPTAYRVCELRAPGQAITQPAPAPANPPAAEPALSPPPPPAAEEAPRAALPPPRAIIDEQAAPAQAPAPAPVAQQPGDEVLQGGAPQPAPSTDELEPVPAPAPAPASTQGSAVVAAAAAPAPSSGAALAAPAAPLLALLLCAAVLRMLL